MTKSQNMLENLVSEILETILGMLALEGSFEVEEQENFVQVSIDTKDAGKLIGRSGENLTALQMIVNQILARKLEDQGATSQFKPVVIDVSQWRKQKENHIRQKAREWANQVRETNSPIELEPMPAWQRRIIHLTVAEIEGVESESIGEGDQRHLIIRPKSS